MQLDFDRGLSPAQPLTAEQAVARGRQLVNAPVSFIMGGGFLLGFLIFQDSALTLIPALGGFIAGWLWWSYWIPRWRAWALRRGVDPNELQQQGRKAKLIWPKGHLLEKTEFRLRGDQSGRL